MTNSLQPISFRGRLAAAAAADRFYLAQHIEALEPDHPDRVFVSLMCCFARDVLTGAVAGPYGADAAELAVRSMLIDERDFAAHRQEPDAVLAERYAVPLDQIAQKRLDLQRSDHLAPERPYA